MSEFESEQQLRERESTVDDGGDVAETPEQDEHGRDADEVTRPAGPAPDERTTGERPSPTG
jgi:hypothetical protein